MKITHVIPALTRGGAERVVVDLANATCDRGHDITILVGHLIEPALYSIDPRVEIRAIRSTGSVRTVYPYLLPWILRNQRWLFAQDIIHCHLTLGAVFGSMVRNLRRLSKRAKPKILETSHAVGMPIPPRRRRLLARLAANRDGYVLMAEDSFWRAFSASNPRLLLRIIPNGTRLDRLSPSDAERSEYRARIGLPVDGRPVVGTIGRLSADRNPAAFVAVFAAIARIVPDAHFLMGGEGPLLDKLKALAISEGIEDRLHFPGLIVDVPLALSVIDLYVSINVGSITGLAGLEAAAAGVPVVALQATTDYPGGPSDWIWSSPNPAALAGEAVRLLRSEADRRALAERQHQHVRSNFSTETAARAYEAFYRELIS